jgi:ribosome-associated protein
MTTKPKKTAKTAPAKATQAKAGRTKASAPGGHAPSRATAKPKPKAKAPPAPKAAIRVRPSTALVAALCRAFSDKKGEDVRVLDVAELSSITDYLVVATGNSETHLRALRIEADRVLKEFGTQIIGRDTQLESGWTVVDAFDVMVHLFTGEKRDHYRLEHLWRDADEVPLEALLAAK